MPTSDIESRLGVIPERSDVWSRFGLVENPFPSRSHPIWEVLFNQEAVVNRFTGDLKDFLTSSATTTMFFTGGNRVGKTHFMQHHRAILPSVLRKMGVALPMTLVSAESCDFWAAYEALIAQLDESLKTQTGHGLFEVVQDDDFATALEGLLPPGDFRQATTRLHRAKEGDRSYLAHLMRQWIRGEHLRAAQRNELGVASYLGSTPQLLNVIDALVKYLMALPFEPSERDSLRVPGVLVFLDEFELVWKHRRDRRDQFLQSIRATIDACPKGLFMCVAMATGLGPAVDDLEVAYPALFARLRGARKPPSLVEVPGVIEAIGYAKAFVDHGRKVAGAAGIGGRDELLMDLDIQKVFTDIAGRTGGTAPQGDFFDGLHIVAERRARSAQ